MATHREPKVSIIGGGVYVARLCELLAKVPSLPPLNLTISARRPDRLAAIARHTQLRVGALRPDWRVTGEPELLRAVEDAQLVVLLVRVGGLPARAYDEEFPSQFGAVGDEGLGLGGLANTWRTVPVTQVIAEAIAQHAPDSRVFNLTAPLGITTRQLLEVGAHAVGLCELPLVTRSKLLTSGPRAASSDCLCYAGLNHLGWFWASNDAGSSVLQQAVQLGLVDSLTYERYGGAPLRYYYEVFDPPAARRLGLVRPEGRARSLLALSERILSLIITHPGSEIREWAERPTPWFASVLVPALTAHLSGSQHSGFADVSNHSRIPQLPAEAVIELAATFTGKTVSVRVPDSVPPAIMDFLVRVASAEGLAYEAARDRDPQLLASAIRVLPLEISGGRVTDIVQAILRGPAPEDRITTGAARN